MSADSISTNARGGWKPLRCPSPQTTGPALPRGFWCSQAGQGTQSVLRLLSLLARCSQQTLTISLGLPGLSTSPPGGDWLTTQPLSVPSCPRHGLEAQVSQSLASGLGCPAATCIDGRIQEARPPSHAPPGVTVSAHVSVEVPVVQWGEL